MRHTNPLYEAPLAPLADAAKMHARLGFERVVVVQATVYTTDHRLLLDTLTELTRARARGVAIIDDSVSNSELERLDRAGVRAVRFNFQKRLGLVPTTEAFRRSVSRIKELGWFVKIFAGPRELPDIYDEIERCDVPVVIDHMGRLNAGQGIDPSGLRLVLRMLERDDRWVMLSNGHRSSAQGYPWDDVVALGRALYRIAPERCIWGSDWPHVGSLGGPMPDDADLLALLQRYLPDPAALEQVLVRNPERLFGF